MGESYALTPVAIQLVPKNVATKRHKEHKRITSFVILVPFCGAKTKRGESYKRTRLFSCPETKSQTARERARTLSFDPPRKLIKD